MDNPSEANDEGITALHNSICAGNFDIVKFLVELGCDVNAADTDGWFVYLCSYFFMFPGIIYLCFMSSARSKGSSDKSFGKMI